MFPDQFWQPFNTRHWNRRQWPFPAKSQRGIWGTSLVMAIRDCWYPFLDGDLGLGNTGKLILETNWMVKCLADVFFCYLPVLTVRGRSCYDASQPKLHPLLGCKKTTFAADTLHCVMVINIWLQDLSSWLNSFVLHAGCEKHNAQKSNWSTKPFYL